MVRDFGQNPQSSRDRYIFLATENLGGTRLAAFGITIRAYPSLCLDVTGLS